MSCWVVPTNTAGDKARQVIEIRLQKWILQKRETQHSLEQKTVSKL